MNIFKNKTPNDIDNWVDQFEFRTISTAIIVSSGLIVAITFLLGQYFESHTAFQRSGAFLVCIALTHAYLSHFTSDHANEYRRLQKLTSHYGNTVDEAKKNIQWEDKPPGEEIQSRVAQNQVNTKRQIDAKVDRLTRLNFTLIKREFSLAIIGTTIWGFGDVFSKIIAWFVYEL